MSNVQLGNVSRSDPARSDHAQMQRTWMISKKYGFASGVMLQYIFPTGQVPTAKHLLGAERGWKY